MTPLRLLAFAFIILIATSFIPVVPDLQIVKTEAGSISGVTNKEGDIIAFKGIPFAAPPVGDLRWKAPQPVNPWPGVRKCEVFAPSPMQPKPAAFSMWSEEFLIPKEPICEDCLYHECMDRSKAE